MHKNTHDYLINNLHIDEKTIDLCLKCEEEAKEQFAKIDEVREYNQYKVLNSMRKNKLSDIHFNMSTGYGYGDIGRDTLDRIYADTFILKCISQTKYSFRYTCYKSMHFGLLRQ